MAALLGMVVAGFAFAGSSKLVNALFPGDKIDHGEEIKRHNLAMEEYTRDREKYNKEMAELAYQEHQRDKNQQSAEIEHGKSVQDINQYSKDWKPPMLEDYLKKYKVNDGESGNSSNNYIVPIAIGSVVIVGVYLYGEYGRHRNERK